MYINYDDVSIFIMRDRTGGVYHSFWDGGYFSQEFMGSSQG